MNIFPTIKCSIKILFLTSEKCSLPYGNTIMYSTISFLMGLSNFSCLLFLLPFIIKKGSYVPQYLSYTSLLSPPNSIHLTHHWVLLPQSLPSCPLSLPPPHLLPVLRPSHISLLDWCNSIFPGPPKVHWGTPLSIQHLQAKQSFKHSNWTCF